MIGISKKGNRFTKSLSNHDLILYSEVWEIVENQLRKNIKESCKKVAFKHPEEKDELLEKLHKRFYEYMRRHKIKSPKDWKNYITNFK